MIDFLLGVPGKLKTVIDHLQTYLSSTRCAKIDNLDAAMSSRAPASTAVSNANYTPARAALLDGIIQTSVIKSIQTGYISQSGIAGSGEDLYYQDRTITAVDISKCIVIVQGVDDSGGMSKMVTGRLTSTTNVRVSSSVASVTGRWYVVEFK